MHEGLRNNVKGIHGKWELKPTRSESKAATLGYGKVLVMSGARHYGLPKGASQRRM